MEKITHSFKAVEKKSEDKPNLREKAGAAAFYLTHPRSVIQAFMGLDAAKNGELYHHSDTRIETPYENKAFIVGRALAVATLAGTVFLSAKSPEAYAQQIAYIGLGGAMFYVFAPYFIALTIEKSQGIKTGLGVGLEEGNAKRAAEKAAKEEKKLQRNKRAEA